jgi:hypothetical protein
VRFEPNQVRPAAGFTAGYRRVRKRRLVERAFPTRSADAGVRIERRSRRLSPFAIVPKALPIKPLREARALWERRRQGMRLARIRLTQAQIEGLVSEGYLGRRHRNDARAIIAAVEAWLPDAMARNPDARRRSSQSS